MNFSSAIKLRQRYRHVRIAYLFFYKRLKRNHVIVSGEPFLNLMLNQCLLLFQGTVLFQGVGCFNDKRNPRPLPELLKNFRGKTFDWLNYNNTIMKCALLAKAKNYKYFGLQFYGECWSGPSADSSFSKDGKSPQCDSGVGKSNAIFVYKFSDQGE